MSASAGEITAGKAFVRLMTDNEALNAGLEAAKSKIEGFLSAVQTIGAALTFKSITGEFTEWLGSFAEASRQMFMLSQRTGSTVEQLDELKRATANSGIEMEDLGHGIIHMQRFLTELRHSGQDANDTFFDLGLTLHELQGQTPIDQFTTIAERIAGIGSAATRTASAVAIFGRAGFELQPAFRGLADARREARAAGELLTPEEVARGFELSVAMKNLNNKVEGVSRAIGAVLAPAFKPIIDLMREASEGASRWIRENETLVQVAGTVGAVLLVGVTGLTGFAAAIQVARFAMGGLWSAMTGFGLVSGTVSTIWAGLSAIIAGGPFVWLGAAIAGIVVYLAATSDSAARLGEMFSRIFDDITQGFRGIVDAMSAGKFELAWEIMTTSLRIVWTEFKDWFIGTWDSIIAGAASAMNRLTGLFTNVSRGLAAAWIRMFQGRAAVEQFVRDENAIDRGNAFLAAQAGNRPANAELETLRARLNELTAEAREARAADERRLAERLATGVGAPDSMRAAGARGQFGGKAAFGLVGRGDDPVVVQLREMNSLEREQLRALERIAQQQAVFQ